MRILNFNKIFVFRFNRLNSKRLNFAIYQGNLSTLTVLTRKERYRNFNKRRESRIIELDPEVADGGPLANAAFGRFKRPPKAPPFPPGFPGDKDRCVLWITGVWYRAGKSLPPVIWCPPFHAFGRASGRGVVPYMPPATGLLRRLTPAFFIYAHSHVLRVSSPPASIYIE